MITLFLFVVLLNAAMVFEIVWSLGKERKSISPPPLWMARLLVGAIISTAYYYELAFNTSDWLVFNVFIMSYYWLLFDGMRNVFEDVNWFKWGETKVIDRLFGQHPGMQMLGHFIKWSLLVGSFLNSAWLHMYTP